MTGSKWEDTKHYRVKLEGASITGFQTLSIVLVRYKKYVKKIGIWTREIKEKAQKVVSQSLNLNPNEYTIEFRLVGKNATLGSLELSELLPCEVGVLVLVTSKEQSTSEEIANILNPLLLHHALYQKGDLPTFAFPFSPPSFNLGPKFEFCLNHTIRVNDPMEIFRIEEV